MSEPQTDVQQPEQQELPVQGAPVQASAPVDPYAELLRGITREDGTPKFGTVSDALNSIHDKEKHIQNLEQRLRDLQEVATKVETFEERLKLMSNEEQVSTTNHDTVAPQQDPETLATIVDQLISQREAQTVAQSNLASVQKALSEKFGEKQEEVYTQRAAELGVTVDVLNSLASQSPAAVLAYFQTAPKSSGLPPSTTQASPVSGNTSQTTEKLWSSMTSSEKKTLAEKTRQEIYAKYS